MAVSDYTKVAKVEDSTFSFVIIFVATSIVSEP